MTKILLVEDDKSLREIYGVRLLAEGYDIISAGDGEEALAMAIKERPGLIVSDVMMPKISGFDMLDILRSTTETKNIKVIMMTALSSEDQRKRGEELGADKYLVKSQVGIEDVVRAVHEVLSDAPVAGGAPAATQSAVPEPAQVPAQAFGSSNTAPAARPAAPVAPQPRPTAQPTPIPAPITPPAPAPVIPAPQPAPQAPAVPQPSSLPEPTAPFSTPRPSSSSSLGRVIEPIQKAEESSTEQVADLIAKELGGSAEAQNDTTAVAPASPVAPAAPIPAPITPPVPQPPAMSYEETPPASAAPTPAPAPGAPSAPTPPMA
ncbi:MAG TPA: response regulator [Candidatus Saccharimonadales bacterium]